MDVVSTVLSGHRGRDAFVLDCAMRTPWSFRVADRAAVALVAAVRGPVAIVRDEEQVTLQPGDVAVITRAEPYVLACDVDEPPTAVIDAGQVCRPLFTECDFAAGPAPRMWGNDPTGATRFVVGVYELPGQVSGRLLAGLPTLITVRAGDDAMTRIVELISAEQAAAGAAQEVMLDRLVDLLLIATLRCWLPTSSSPSWWYGAGDPVVREVLSAMHDRPDHAWTLDSLARHASVSRSTLARRFADTVGEPPLRYLANHRLALAADRLAESDASVEAIAREVGYSNAFAFSTAFRREYGTAPRAYRAAANS